MRWLSAAMVVPSLVLALWLSCWQLVVGAVWWWGATAVLLAVALGRRPSRGGWGAWLVAGFPAAAWCLFRYGQRVDTLSQRVFSSGADALTWADRVAIWGLNLVMAAAGAVLGFPEVAAETARLSVPSHGEVHWEVDGPFPSCVPKIRRAVERGGQRVTWSYDAEESLRGALALNPATVVVRPVAEGRRVSVTVPVDYPPRSRLTFLSVGPWSVPVEEGLFHALETLGWLHPYQLTYTWTEPLDAPPVPPCEAWALRWLGDPT